MYILPRRTLNPRGSSNPSSKRVGTSTSSDFPFTTNHFASLKFSSAILLGLLVRVAENNIFWQEEERGSSKSEVNTTFPLYAVLVRWVGASASWWGMNHRSSSSPTKGVGAFPWGCSEAKGGGWVSARICLSQSWND